MSITTKKLNELAKDYGKWSSWAIWSDENKHDTNVITSNVKELNINYVVVALNVSKALKEAWSNFHSGRHDEKLMYAFNHSFVRGAYMTDLFKLPHPNSKQIDSYLAESKNTKDIHQQIVRFQKELNDVGVNRKTIFILLGRQVQQYFPFFLTKELYSNRRILIPHYSAYISSNTWLKIAQGRINGNL